ncbi:MAG: MarR family transcriptional regulator [Candidatus Nanopelagicales bacterium]
MDERDDLEVAADRLRVVVGRLARGLRTTAGGGITPTQLSALATVDRHGPLRLSALAEIEAVNPTMLSRLVARLEEDGLLRRTPDPDDGRAALVAVTADGRRALGRLRARRSAYLRDRLTDLTERDVESVLTALDALERLAGVPDPVDADDGGGS